MREEKTRGLKCFGFDSGQEVGWGGNRNKWTNSRWGSKLKPFEKLGKNPLELTEKIHEESKVAPIPIRSRNVRKICIKRRQRRKIHCRNDINPHAKGLTRILYGGCKKKILRTEVHG